ncbi:surface antigen (D15) [Pirellula staleyi DSM 6068]|uniref:Surface antigen (D15) n=1 Tax=Pirellula staleyi (strain ATCC 27377 / DSM 6068 / ICPB 4128) TaxID=530564 RepID=D2R6N2_PIRSD|nr:BamA/TamA family outer membrane protein [Pirellula staleyi]ADB17332.1 surface antigen (D15) [Pirellula staleyi DSM 6068]
MKRYVVNLLLALGTIFSIVTMGCVAPQGNCWNCQSCAGGSCGYPAATAPALPADTAPRLGPTTTNYTPPTVTTAASEEPVVRFQSPDAYDSAGLPGGDLYRRGPMPVSGQLAQNTAPTYPSYGQPNYAPQPSAYGTQPAAPPTYSTAPQPYTPQPYAPPSGTPSTFASQPGYSPPPAVYPGAGNPAIDNFGTPPLPPPPAGTFEVPPAGAPNAISNPSGGSGGWFGPSYPLWQPPSNIAPTAEEIQGTPTPLDIVVQEARTGRFMFGVGVNSDAGVTGQITVDERNFDIFGFPSSWDDFANGTAFRGRGQGFRLEAQPGDQVQRYLVSFTDPYFMDSNVSFSASAFYFDRNYYDYDESRYGGRLSWGYRLSPDLSVSGAVRAENVNVFDPRVLGVAELDNALGKHDLFSGKVTLTHDTRDLIFMPTEGHLIELSYEQVFGDFDYPRFEAEYSKYFLLRERPDGSGRHTLSFSSRAGFTGSQTPIFENYFAGGYSTLRGFSFRGASPIDNTVRVGGEFRWLNSVEYFFPLTADDMIKGTVFCDFGTVEQEIALNGDNFRVAPGFGLRVSVPALGPAPLALDFAFPVSDADGDDRQVFSFFVGATRQ